MKKYTLFALAALSLSLVSAQQSFAQCAPITIAGKHCDGQRAIFPKLTGGVNDTFEWFQDADGLISDGTNTNTAGGHISRFNVPAGQTSKDFYIRRRSPNSIGGTSTTAPTKSIQTKEVTIPAGSGRQAYEMQIEPNVDFTLNSLKVWVDAYTGTPYSLKVRVVPVSDVADVTKGTYTDWFNFAGTGNKIQLEIPVDITVKAGGPYLIQIVNPTAAGTNAIPSFYFNEKTTPTTTDYLTAPNTIKMTSVVKTAYGNSNNETSMTDLDITINCPLQKVTSTFDGTDCCTPVKNVTVTSSGTAPNITLTASSTDANASSFYYEWYDENGLALAAPKSGLNVTTLSVGKESTYRVKVVEREKDLQNISCYKEASIVIGTVPYTVNAKKTSACKGDSVQLQATLSTGAIFKGWTTLDGEVDNITNPSDLTTYVTPKEPTTYVANAIYQLGNLVTNGDFEGSGGFSSTYTPATNITPGTYAIGTDPKSYNSWFVNHTDHTPGAGDKMLIVDGDLENSQIAYRTSVPVVKGMSYAFSFWIANIHTEFANAQPNISNAQPSKVQFVIDGQELIKVNTLPDVQWRQYVQTFTATETKTVDILLRNNADPEPKSGNDFIIDDVVFAPLSPTVITDTVFVRPCVPPCNKPTSVSITSTSTISGTGANKSISICEGANPLPSLNGSFQSTGTNKFGPYKYSWYKKKTNPTYVATPITKKDFLAESEAGTWVLRVEDYNGSSPVASCYLEDSIKFIVTPKPVAPDAKDTTYCQNATAVPLKASADAGNSLLWYDVASNGTALSGAALTPSTTTAGSPAKSYWVSQKTPANLGGCEGPRKQVNINVIQKPATLTPAAPSGFCESTTAPVWAATPAAGNSLVWYDVASGGTASTTIPAIPNTPAGIKTVYVAQKTSAANGGCESDRAKIEVTVFAGMKAGTIDSNQTICQGATTVAKILSLAPATGGSGAPTYSWESSTDGNTWTSIPGQSGLEYTPSVPTVTTYYRRLASAGSQQCDKAETDPVKITVVVPPTAHITAPKDVTSPNSASHTFNETSLNITATPAGTGYVGTWSVGPKGTLGSAATSATNTVIGMAYDDQSTLTWTVKDEKGKCTPAIATITIERKNITVADAKDDSLCITALNTPYALVGNGLITGETANWEFVSATPSIVPIWSQDAADQRRATITSVSIPADAGKVELLFKYTVTSPLKPDPSFKIVKITIYEQTQVATTGPQINTCASFVKLTGNKITQATASGKWTIDNGQGALTDASNFETNLTGLDNVGMTNLTWTISNHVCPATSANLVVDQKGKSTDAIISITGGAYNSTDITNKTDVALCVGVAYTVQAVLPSTGLKPNETAVWTNSNAPTIVGSNPSASFNPTMEGLAEATWTIDPNIVGCVENTANAKFVIGGKPVLDAISDPSSLCENTESPFDVTLSTAVGVNNLPILSYAWTDVPAVPTSTGKATLQGLGTASSATFRFTSTKTTSAIDQATLSVTATNACGTSDPVTKLITINLTPRDFAGVITGSDSVCETSIPDETYVIDPQANTTSYSWTLGTAPPIVGTQPNVTIPVADLKAQKPDVPLKVLLQNACGDGVSQTLNIHIINADPINPDLTGKQQICLPTETVQFTGSAPQAGSLAIYEFSVLHNGVEGKKQSSTLKTFDVGPGDVQDGDQIRLVVIGDPADGCFSPGGTPAILPIDGYMFPDTTITSNLLKDSVCQGQVIQFCVKKDKNNRTFEWFQNGVLAGTSNCQSIATSAQSGFYTVKVSNGVCAALTSMQRSAKVYEQPLVQFVPDYIMLELLENPATRIDAVVTGVSLDPLINKTWSSTSLLSDFTADSLHATFTSPTAGGDFYYSLTVETGGGTVRCPHTGQVHIKALPPVKVPNAFSPNGDGLNETWQIDGIETYPNARVSLYNRWGSKVFEVSPYLRQDEWDGTIHGANVPTGTYYYIIDLRENTVKQSKIITGSLTVVR